MINAKTKVCCIIGDPVEHSFSPAMHNAAYAALGLDFAYVAFRVKDLAAAVWGIRALGIRGASVTIPHKVAVMEHLDKLDPVAEGIGSVNTIVNDEGELTGMNTDGAGAMKALLDAGAELAGKSVLIIGSGGASRAIAVTLASRGGIGRLDIIGIVEPELEKLAEDVKKASSVQTEWSLVSEENLERAFASAEVVIHATPVGMHPKVGESAVPAELWRSGLTVMDIVYNPRRTRLLEDAEAAGCKVVQGFEMLLNQGVLQFEVWTGKDAPTDVMREALEKALG